MAITRARAVELVASLPTELPPGQHELVVHAVVEHSLGWIISCESPEFVRTGDWQHALIGGGPYLVDLHDWAALYLRQVKGIRPPDPLAAEVRTLARADGAVVAMAHLRRRASRLSLRQAKAYLPAVREGAEPPESLADLTEEKVVCPPLPIDTVRPGHV
ncbi:YrhB domain-containing protein [Kitasatospora sp. NPDC091257]|uniref:YrhB domain-containing protein n=1 Tax=Kitasatospora sp. NPDC091257 TaxID=3364084 RepID=UPI0037FA4495